DYLLKQILSKFLLPNVGSSDDLLDTERPLGTFGSRIHAAYRFGLINADFTRALHIFRRFRNTFAHEVAGTTFDHGPSKDRIRELSAPLKVFNVEFAEFRDAFFRGKPEIAADFYSVAVILIVRLEALLVDTEPLSGATAMALVPE